LKSQILKKLESQRAVSNFKVQRRGLNPRRQVKAPENASKLKFTVLNPEKMSKGNLKKKKNSRDEQTVTAISRAKRSKPSSNLEQVAILEIPESGGQLKFR
jgi:hypothetical protein